MRDIARSIVVAIAQVAFVVLVVAAFAWAMYLLSWVIAELVFQH